MPFDQGLAERIRDVLQTRPDIEERRMFGGLAFLLGGRMTCGIIGDELVVHLGDARASSALALPHTRPMTFTGRAIRSMIYVEPPGFEDDEDLRMWVVLGLDHAVARGAAPPSRKRSAKKAKPAAKTTAKPAAKKKAKPAAKKQAKPAAKKKAKPPAKTTAKPPAKKQAKPAAKTTAKPAAKKQAKPAAKKRNARR